jgi:glycopeptide antibiotics resistance protein
MPENGDGDEVLGSYQTWGYPVMAAVAAIAAGVVVLGALRRGDVAAAVRGASAVLLVAAVSAILLRTLHPHGTSTASVRLNLIPGDSIRDLFKADNVDAVQNVCGNIALFIPIGFLGVLALRWRTAAVTAAATVFSAVIELAQLTVGGRWVDVDDVLLNCLGALVGAVAASMATRIVQRRDSSRRQDQDREAVR